MVPAKVSPARSRAHILAQKSAVCRSDRNTRGVAPTSSTAAYPVLASTAGFTYPITPCRSVMTTQSAVSSTAADRTWARSSARRFAVTSRKTITPPRMPPDSSITGLALMLSHMPSGSRGLRISS